MQVVDVHGTMPTWAKNLAEKIVKTESIRGPVHIYWKQTKRDSSHGIARPYSLRKEIRIWAGRRLVSQRDLLIHELVHLVREKERGSYAGRTYWHDERFYQILFYWQYAIGDIYISLVSEFSYKSRGAIKAMGTLGIDQFRLLGSGVSIGKLYGSRETAVDEITKRLRRRVKPVSEGWKRFDPDTQEIYETMKGFWSATI